MSIVEFLLARITEEEADNSPDIDPEAWCDRQAGIHYTHDHIAAECVAKRAVVAIHALKDAGSGTSIDPDHREVGCETCNWDTSYWWLEYGPCDTLKALAAVHADHPDYNQEWKI